MTPQLPLLPAKSVDQDPELLQGFIDEARESLAGVDRLLVDLERTRDLEIIQAIFRPVHSIKGNASFFGLEDLRGLAHDLEGVLDHARRGALEITGPVSNLLLEGLDALRKTLGHVTAASGESPELTRLRASLRAVLAPGTVSTTQAIRPPVSSSSIQRPTTERERAASDDQAIRVPMTQIDGFLDLVGELLVLGDLFQHVQGRLETLPALTDTRRDLQGILGQYGQITDGMRRSVIGLRQVPAKRLLHKVPRLVRDAAVARHKEIRVELMGEELGLDKAVADLLQGPLVQLVRHAADQGIEDPAQRIARGKPAEGTVTVRIVEEDAAIRLMVVDDGDGQGQDPLDEDVRRAVEAVGGSIVIKAISSQGTTVTMLVPKAARTQILPGFQVLIADRVFILPLDRVERTVVLDPQAIHHLPGGEARLLCDGESYRHHDLGLLLGCGGALRPVTILVMMGGKRHSFAVDAVLGVRQVLVRSIAGRWRGPMVAGGAVMGDGRVAVVLDPDRLLDSTPS